VTLRRFDDEHDRVAVLPVEHPVALDVRQEHDLVAFPHDPGHERGPCELEAVPVDEQMLDAGGHAPEPSVLTVGLWLVALVLGFWVGVAELVKAAV
jgi:hypothetical protein